MILAMTPTFEIHSFRESGERFLANLLLELQAAGAPDLDYDVDHLCYRTETKDQYALFKEHLLAHAELLTESPVNGRPIATFALREPFRVHGKLVSLVELPSPKSGSPYKLGFEHAEVVIKESFERFQQRFPAAARFQIAGNRNTNPELCLKLPSGQVKFHYLALDRIIEIEKANLTDLIFDFDGTLIHSREHIYEINRRVFSEALGRPVSLAEAEAKFHPEFSALFAAFEVDCPDKQKRAVQAWGEIAEEYICPLFDGVTDLIKNLSEGPWRLHLWTARDEVSSRAILESHGLTRYFETLSFATERDSKPHSSSLQFDWRSAEPNSFLLIGDSPTDIRGAKNTGCIAAAALWDPYIRKDDLIATGAELYFYTPEEFFHWVKAISSSKLIAK